MEFTVNKKKVKVQRIVDLPQQKKIRVFLDRPLSGPIVLEGEKYKNGIFNYTKEQLKTEVQKLISKS